VTKFKMAGSTAAISMCMCAGLITMGLIMLASTSVAVAQDGHQGHHDHGGAAPEMDALGRRLDPAVAEHEMSDEQLAALREKISLYRALTDAEARLNMALMGANYAWYVSDLDLEGGTGVLILAHGVGENSDKLFVEALQPMAEQRPTAISFGMAMMMSSQLQAAVDDLTERGAETIVLVPTAMTEYNSLTRQWEYIFGMRDESSYLDVPRVESSARFLMAKHFDDHPLVTEMLSDYTLAQSKNPGNEVVIIVGHGPEEIEDNVPDLVLMQKHADRIKASEGFADVKVINLQDDAYPPIRKSNVKKLRRWVTSAQRSGQDVIITVATSASFGVQAKVRQDLRGLDYAFADKGMTEHPNYLKWIEATVAERLTADISAGEPVARN
jgi:sirohydrochlorin cobaltochelatase